MLVLYTLFFILYLMISTLIGLNIASKIENSVKYSIFWITYIIINLGLLNVLLLSSFWADLQFKTGPPGTMGLKGDKGKTGNDGICTESCKSNECIKTIEDVITNEYRKLKNDDTLEVTNLEIKKAINQVCNSKQYTILAPIKGANNLIDYISEIWKKWIQEIINVNHNFLSDTNATNVSYNWGSTNPYQEIQKYDMYHWGKTKKFKGLGMGICPNVNITNFFPKYDKPVLQLLETNNYFKAGKISVFKEIPGFEKADITQSKETKHQFQDPLYIWQPIVFTYKNEKYYPLTQIITTSAHEPSNSQAKKIKIGNKEIMNYSIAKTQLGNKKVELIDFNNKRRRFIAGRYEDVSDFGINNIRKYFIPVGFIVTFYKNNMFSGEKVEIIGNQSMGNSYIDLGSNYKSVNIREIALGVGPDILTYLVTGDVRKPIRYEKIWSSEKYEGAILKSESLNTPPEQFVTVKIDTGGRDKTGNDVKTIGMPNDWMSSIIVGEGHKLTLWEDWGEGLLTIVTGPTMHNLGRWTNNETSSYTLERTEEESITKFSIWRPIAPDGYAFLSDVINFGSYGPPSINDPPIVAVPTRVLETHSIKKEEKGGIPEYAATVTEYPWNEKERGWIRKLKSHIGKHYVKGINGRYPTSHTNIPNDDIDGIQVNPNFKITLYQGSFNSTRYKNHTYMPGIHNNIGEQGLQNQVTGIEIEYTGTMETNTNDPNILFKSSSLPLYVENDTLEWDEKGRQKVKQAGSDTTNKNIFSILGYINNKNVTDFPNNILDHCFRVEPQFYNNYNRINNIPPTENLYKFNLDKLKQIKIENPRNLDLVTLKNNENDPNKEIDPTTGISFAELGLGWHGMPLREPQHSIFSFIGLMPEGIISHKSSERKYYITHSGEYEKKGNTTLPINSYLILSYNTIAKKYNKALSCDESSDRIAITAANKNDKRQLWKIDPVSNNDIAHFTFKSLATNKYLSVKPKGNLRGRSIEKQVSHKDPLNIDNSTTTFVNNKSAFGTSINSIRYSPDYTEKDREIENTSTPYRFVNIKNENNITQRGVYDPIKHTN